MDMDLDLDWGFKDVMLPIVERTIMHGTTN